MHNSRPIYLLVSIFVCGLLASATGANIDETTGCPTDIAHQCDICVDDGTQFGCFCELPEGGETITPNLNTPCPLKVVDPCTNNSCSNGAVCVSKGLTDYTCNCTAGYGGRFCSESLPKCADANVVCPNGQCIDTGNAALPVYCRCYDGTPRDPLKNETCPPNPCYVAGTEYPVCQNNGTCTIVNNAPVCQCKGGWAGPNCTKALKQPICETKPTACGPGRCYQTLVPERYFCDCGNYPNTVAKTLDDLTPCDQSACYMNNPCLNGGTCANKGQGGFTCLCPSQYVGYKCQNPSPCFTNPCRNRGTCQALNETTYVCSCPPYFAGQNCEISLPNPCAGKNCGYGGCLDINGVAACNCSDGVHPDGTPCQDPCIGKNCNLGVCVAGNGTSETYCSCPIYRKGASCELPNDVCREAPRCGGGYCRPNYGNTRQYECVCENNVVQKDPCPFIKKADCLTADCGTRGVCVQTGGLIVRPGTPSINYVCSCQDGYISSGDCNGLLATQVPAAETRCGINGKPYPSRNPLNPIGCWCKNGTHLEEITDAFATPICG